jgi:UDP-N-acetylmuramate--alanine ligase
VAYAPAWEELRRVVAGLLRPGDLCLTLGAGDLTTLPDELLESPGW